MSHPLRSRRVHRSTAICSFGAWLILFALVLPIGAEDLPPPLSSVPVPLPPDLGDYVKDDLAAKRLGKAFFWDMGAGSDGETACATCHFHAGVDNRERNTLNHSTAPSFMAVPGAPNSTLTLDDFPFHEVEDPDEPESPTIADTPQVVGSQGVIRRTFTNIVPGSGVDDGTTDADPTFHVMGINTRQTTGLQAPTTINTIFNIDNFWNGRAKSTFNGVNPFGDLDPNAQILRVEGTGDPVLCRCEIHPASAASQAVGPPLSDVEMSWNGRLFPDLGKKLLSLQPLSTQQVHPSDSLLGPHAVAGGPGLDISYRELIEAAFWEAYWDSDAIIDAGQNIVGHGLPAGPDEYSLMESNFALFWGLSIMLYESTLVSDQTRVDEYLGGDTSALSLEEEVGLELFFNINCGDCHSGPLLSNATWGELSSGDSDLSGPVLRMDMEVGDALYDKGYYNIGVRPTPENLGRGGTGPGGVPLSWTGKALLEGEGALPIVSNLDPPVTPGEPTALMGTFKTPNLRNIALTGPYFHNGGYATLMGVIHFYGRGGDFPEENQLDLHGEISPIGKLKGHPARQAALVAFLEAMTDERVRWEMEPFDHPELRIPNGHLGDENMVQETSPGSGVAADNIEVIPAVGAAGRGPAGLPPLAPFLDADQGAAPLAGVMPQTISSFTCTELPGEVVLSWTNDTAFTAIEVERDLVVIAILDGHETQFVDAAAAVGVHEWSVKGILPSTAIGRAEGCFARISTPGASPTPSFLRGDADGDGLQTIGDAIRVLNYVFGGSGSGCLDAYDSNDTGTVDIADPISHLMSLFGQVPALPLPSVEGCGPDPTTDGLDCVGATGCP